MIEIIYLLSTVSVVSSGLAVYFWRKSRIARQRPESLELQEFLFDLMSGGGLVHVKRVAPNDVLIRTRRQ